jgi:hypothetical protein
MDEKDEENIDVKNIENLNHSEIKIELSKRSDIVSSTNEKVMNKVE